MMNESAKQGDVKEIRIQFDYSFGPIWKDRFNAENDIFVTGIPIIDNDKALNILDKEANQIYSALYSWKDGRLVFDNKDFEDKKKDLLSLVETIILRLNEINDGSFIVSDEATESLKEGL